MIRFLLFSILFLPLMTPYSFAQNTDPTSVDLIESQILSNADNKVPAIAKAYSNLEKEDLKSAMSAVDGLRSNPEYRDLYHFLYGKIYLRLAQKDFEKKQYKAALQNSEKAEVHFATAQGINAYSGFIKRSRIHHGEAELISAQCKLQTKEKQAATALFESAFQRLSDSTSLVRVPKAATVSYAKLCDANKTDICRGWLARLKSYIEINSETRIVETLARVKKQTIERPAQQIPYKVDQDLQLFPKYYAEYLKGNYDVAYAGWRDLLKEYPKTTYRLRTKFWMARAAQKTAHHAHAETLYKEIIRELPFSYYALMASWFGGIDLSRMMSAEIPNAINVADDLDPDDIVHLRRAETFLANGAKQLAAIELQAMRANSAMTNEFIVYVIELNHMAENHLGAFQGLSELSSRGFLDIFSVYGQKFYFPTTRMATIEKAASEWKVDPLIVASVIKQESAFNVEAASSSSAFGLMQIIPPTARDLKKGIETRELLNPELNVNLGSKYISQLLAKFNGNIMATLAAYNAGPGNSDRWIRESGHLPPEEYIEQISFRETREYVQNILRNYYWYNRRLKGEIFPDLQTLLQKFGWKQGDSQRSPASLKKQKRISIHSKRKHNSNKRAVKLQIKTKSKKLTKR